MTLPSAPVSLRRLLQLARIERAPLLIGMLFLAISSSMTLVVPQALRQIIDNALTQRRSDIIDRTALIMCLLFAVQGATSAGRYILFSNAGERIVARLRRDLYASILRQEIAFFDQRATGELINRLASDTTVLQNAVSVNISMALRNVTSILGGVSLLLYTSPRLTLIMLSVVPPVAIGAMAQGRRVRKLARDVQDALGSASNVAEESIGGIRTVRSFAAESIERERYGAAVDQSYSIARNRVVSTGVFMGVASFFAYAAVAMVLWYGGRLVLTGRLSVGGLTSFLVYTIMVAFSMGSLSELWADLMKAAGAAERVFALLDRAPTMPVVGGMQLDAIEGNLSFEAVEFAYPARRDAKVLHGLDLEIRAGEVVALVGPSGAGKSTIASLLSRLYDPDAGRITLDGHDVREFDPDWLRRHVGAVSQEPILFSSTIRENIRYGRPDASEAEIEAAARAANAHEFVTRFPEGYDTPVGERGVQLSGGQKQRIAIARAVLKNPRILILDEATSALDAESEHLVQDALDRLMKGRTTLVIAHRLSTVVGADRVLVLDSGRLVQSGDHRGLMSQDGLYKRLVERQFVAA